MAIDFLLKDLSLQERLLPESPESASLASAGSPLAQSPKSNLKTALVKSTDKKIKRPARLLARAFWKSLRLLFS